MKHMAYPHEMQHYAAYHLGLNCLPKLGVSSYKAKGLRGRRKIGYRERSGSVVECLTRDRPRVQASPVLVCCVLEQDTYILA